jgi:hypothetical protein
VKYLIILSSVLLLPACECGIKIESKPTEAIRDVFDAGISDPDPEVQAILNKFTPEQISQMFADIPLTDKRPESERSSDLLYKAIKAIERNKGNPRLRKADRVNEVLRDL